MSITFQGIDNGAATKSLQTAAFALPPSNGQGIITATVNYNAATSPPSYQAYLVQLSAYDTPTDAVTFSAIDLSTGKVSTKAVPRTLQLGDYANLWAGAPSCTLASFLGDQNNNCAILLLTSTFVSDKPEFQAALAGRTNTGHVNKWPAGAYEPDQPGRRKLAMLLHELLGVPSLDPADRARFTTLLADYL